MSEAYLKEIQLPSQGKFYGGQVPDGLITIEPMGTKEEKLFSAGSATGVQVINQIFDSCVHCPINHKDLVLGDRMYCLLQVRSVSYGANYEYSFKCQECGKKSYATVDLDDLPLLTPREGVDDPSKFTVSLPLLGNELTLRLLTGKDEEKVQSYVRQLASKTRGQGNAAEYIYRLARRIDLIDGNEVGIREAMEFVESLKGADSLELRDEIRAHEVGPEQDMEPTCQHCGFLNGPIILPFEQEFFRPRRHRPSRDDYLKAAESLDAVKGSSVA